MTLWYNRLLNWLNFSYLKTFEFVFKIIILILSASGAISAAWNPFTINAWQTVFYHIVTVSIIILYIIIVLLNYLNVVIKFDQIPWTFIELIIGAVYIILFIISSSIVTSLGQYSGRAYFIAAGIIGFGAALVLIIDGIVRFVLWRRGPVRRATPASTQ